jgi:hypothetical protein
MRTAGRCATLLVHAAAVLVVGSAAGLSAAHAQVSPGPAPVAQAPVFKVGDEWRWTGGGRRRIIAIEGEHTVTPMSNQECQNCRAYRDKNLTVVKLLDKEGNIVVNDSSVGYKMLDFPLAVGKRWDSDVSLVNRRTRVAEAYKNTFHVETYEEVKTKAGTFKAFRITHIQQRAHTSFSGDVGKTWRETLWYGPEVKAFVKREVNTKVEWGPDWELESYALK